MLSASTRKLAEDLEHELEKIRDSVMTFMVDGKAVSYKEFMSKLEEMRER